MRTRTRNVITKSASQVGGTRPYGRHLGDGSTYSGTTTVGTYTNMPLAGVDERVTDELGKGVPHKCIHRKRIWTKGPETNVDYVLPYPAAPWGYHSWGDSKLNWNYNWDAYNGSNLDWNVSSDTGLPSRWSMTLPTSANEDVLKESAIEAARQLKADVLLNLVEANQIWPAITSLATALPTMGKYWYAGDSLRKYIKTASGAFLAWKFGISPILSDMMAVHRYLPKLKSDIRQHGNQEKRRFSSNADLTCSFDNTSWDRDSYNGYVVSKVFYQGIQMKSPTVRYVLVVRPKTKYHTSFFQAADMFMSRFATSPASLAWEKIPFSFVVDWFVDLRGVLRRLDSLLGVEPFEVVSFTRSHSYHLNTTIWHAYRDSYTGEDLNNQVSGQAEFKHYERSVVSAAGSMPTWKPRFGKNQAGISAALISQKLSTLRSRRGIW